MNKLNFNWLRFQGETQPGGFTAKNVFKATKKFTVVYQEQ